jgi:hypothetical protein
MSTVRALAGSVIGPDSVEPALSWRTGADIERTPLGELIIGMIEPDGPVHLYAPGGTGKGMTLAWMVRELHGMGIRPLIYDAENRPGEWARRLDGLCVPADWWVYVQPHEMPAHLLGKPLPDVVPHLGDVAGAAGCRILVVDSIMAAANLSEEGLKGDAAAPYKYTAALAQTGLLSISVGHTTKGNPNGDPYGSVAWVNAFRLTWHGARAEGDQHAIRWTPRKRNERGHIRGILLKFEYDAENRPCAVEQADDDTATRQWLIDALMQGPQTVEDLVERLAEEGTDGLSEAAVQKGKERLRQALYRMKTGGLAHKAKGRGAPWSLGAGVT